MGEGQTQEEQYRIEVEQDRIRLEFDRMTEGGRGRIIPESMGADMERNGRGEVRTANPRTGSELMPSGRAESATRRQEQPGEESS